MTARGVWVVVRQEFRVRLRTGRWRWLLTAWVLVVLGFTALLDTALSHQAGDRGVPLFGGLMLFVLGLALVVSPALTAQSVNGDRERGTLATLQLTRLTAAEIAVGKLVAGWAVGLCALALTLPFVGWAVAEGGVTIGRTAAVLLVVALLIGVVCALSLGISALVPRSITSALLSYLTVFGLSIGTVIVFGLSVGAIGRSDSSADVWWMLAPNPFVILADATPQLPPRRDAAGFYVPQAEDPLGELGRQVRSIRTPGYLDDRFEPRDSAPVWPYGLTVDLLAAAGAVWLTARRLRTPTATLPPGVRVA